MVFTIYHGRSKAMTLKKTWFFDLSKTGRDSPNVYFRSLAIFLKAIISAGC